MARPGRRSNRSRQRVCGHRPRRSAPQPRDPRAGARRERRPRRLALLRRHSARLAPAGGAPQPASQQAAVRDGQPRFLRSSPVSSDYRPDGVVPLAGWNRDPRFLDWTTLFAKQSRHGLHVPRSGMKLALKILVALIGLALFAWFVKRAGPAEIAQAFT